MLRLIKPDSPASEGSEGPGRSEVPKGPGRSEAPKGPEGSEAPKAPDGAERSDIDEIKARSAAAPVNEIDEIDAARSLLAQLPPTSRIRLNAAFWRGVQGEASRDAGAYDLLLHSRDTPFTVASLFEWIQAQGLHINAVRPAPPKA